MSDYISRQAAIDAVEESRRLNHHQDGKEACAHEYEHRHFLKILMELPSAEPEIIRCGQCKYAEVADSEDSQDGYTCQFHRGSIWFSGSYCSWAERRYSDG